MSAIDDYRCPPLEGTPSSDLENNQPSLTHPWEQPGFNVDQALEEAFKKILGNDYQEATARLISISPPQEPTPSKIIINQIPATSPQPAQELMRRRSTQELAANTRFMGKRVEQIQQRLLQLQPLPHQASCLGRIERMGAPSCPEVPIDLCKEDGPTLQQPAIPTPKPSSPPQAVQGQGDLSNGDDTI